jgi:hypothetical protein
VRRVAALVSIGVALIGLPAHADSTGRIFRLALGGDIDAWPFGFAFQGGLWVDRWPFLASVHLRAGAIRKEYVREFSREYAALQGSYGAQVGFGVRVGELRPYVLGGYERLGTILYDVEGGGPDGRTQQAITAELGLPIRGANRVDLLVGIRAFFPIADGRNPHGPPLPRVAASGMLLF